MYICRQGVAAGILLGGSPGLLGGKRLSDTTCPTIIIVIIMIVITIVIVVVIVIMIIV